MAARAVYLVAQCAAQFVLASAGCDGDPYDVGHHAGTARGDQFDMLNFRQDDKIALSL